MPAAPSLPAAPFIVVIAGGTASGKTTVAVQAAARLGALLLHHDRYYKDVAQPRGHNYDHPDALDTARLVADLDTLRAGQTAHLPVYDFRTHSRQAHTEQVQPTPVIIVEGILTLADPQLRARADLAVFVDAPADVRLARRVLRDVADRGRDLVGVIDQYLGTVRPMHESFVEPTRALASLVLNGTAPVDTLVQTLTEALTRAQVLPTGDAAPRSDSPF